MSATVRVRVNRLPEMRAKFPGAVEAVFGKTVADAQAIARSRAPVDTGLLKGSIMTELEVGDAPHGRVFTGVEYATYQEYGTRFVPPHPYMTPAFEQTAPACLAALGAIERAL